jgi:hypothetical protein
MNVVRGWIAIHDPKFLVSPQSDNVGTIHAALLIDNNRLGRRVGAGIGQPLGDINDDILERAALPNDNFFSQNGHGVALDALRLFGHVDGFALRRWTVEHDGTRNGTRRIGRRRPGDGGGCAGRGFGYRVMKAGSGKTAAPAIINTTHVDLILNPPTPNSFGLSRACRRRKSGPNGT